MGWLGKLFGWEKAGAAPAEQHVPVQNQATSADTSGFSRRVFIRYQDEAGAITERMISIRRVTGELDNALFHARCHLRNDYREFRVERVMEMIDAETGETLNPWFNFLMLQIEGGWED